MARATGKHVLDVNVTPTESRPSVGKVQEALDALQIRAQPRDAQSLAATPVGAVLCALVKHLGASGGFYSAISLDDSNLPALDDARAPGPREHAPRRFPR